MHFSIAFVSTLCLLTSTTLAVDTTVVRLLLNKDSTNLDSRCSEEEWSVIDSILTDSTKATNDNGQRNLRSVIDGNNDNITNEVKSPKPSPKTRELWPAYCKDDCAGYATGTCRKPGCAGYLVAPPAPTSEPLVRRELWPAYCKDDCAGYATGTCRKPGCAGYLVAPPAPTSEPLARRELWPAYCKDDCAGYATGTCRKPGCAGYLVAPPAPTSEPLVRRELWPAYCKDDCAGYTTGTCRKAGCAGYLVAPPAPTSQPLVRRRQLSNSNTMITTLCPKKQIQFIHEKLNDLIRQNKVSTTCKAVLKQKRHVTCYHHGNDDKIVE
jgi:hypothetical protein